MKKENKEKKILNRNVRRSNLSNSNNYLEQSGEEKKVKKEKTPGVLVTLSIVAFFIISFLIIYRESILDSKVKEINKVKEDIKKIEKENSQIELGFQSKISLNNIEKEAETRLGMKKQSKDNTIYVKLDVEDFIDPVVITKIENEDESFFKKISNFILDLIYKDDNNGDGIKIKKDDKKEKPKEDTKEKNKEQK